MKKSGKFKLGLILVTVLAVNYSFAADNSTAKDINLNINSNESSLSKEMTRQSKENWNETHNLRQKQIQLEESRLQLAHKELDKKSNAIDKRDICEQSSNVNAYWEPHTQRCLDRSTGRSISLR